MDFVKDIIAGSECPVVTPPNRFTDIDEIVFCYDDSRSSAFAIKQFTYLFPEMEELKMTMLHVSENVSEIQSEKLSQWLSAHYSYAVFKTMTGKVSAELYKHLYNKKRTLVIIGSYGRNALSTLLFPSTADSLLQNADLPFFFAHN